MPSLSVQCQSIPIPDPPPSMNIPHLGIIQAAWDSLHRIPSPDELLLKFHDAIAALLAPVRRFLELVEIVLSIQDCILAIPSAILKLSPGPIWDCASKLATAIARILSYIPPLAYIRMGLDICSYVINVIDEIFLLLMELDEILTSYIEAFTNAQLLGDTDLQAILTCGATEVKAQFTIVLDLLKIVKPLNDIIMTVFLRTIPSSSTRQQLAKAQASYQQLDDYGTTARTQFQTAGTIPAYPGASTSSKTQHPLVPIPPIGDLMFGLNVGRNAMVTIYNLLSPIVGLSPDKTYRDAPVFDNF